MKNLKWALSALLFFLATTTFQSCGDNDGYSIGDMGASWATVRVLSGNTYYLDSDRFGTLWLAADDARWYKPVNGERVISYFNPLVDNYEGYDMAIKLEAIYPILTKTVQELTPENSESFGNDPIVIMKGDLWVSNGYMNIIFRQNVPVKEKHLISLVQGESVTGDNPDYVYLELRYNNFDDLSGYWRDGAVSFNLNGIDFEKKKGIMLKINSEANGEVDIQIDLSKPADQQLAKFNRAMAQENMLQ